MTDKLIATVAALPRCQHEINLPVQAGHDEILKVMRRGYTVARYRDLAGGIRAAMPDVALTTDIIVGHPARPRRTSPARLRWPKRSRFDKIHIAMYSARPGTRAGAMEADPQLAVPESEKHARRIALEQLQEQIATSTNARLLGQQVEVLVEGEHKGKWRGRTTGNKLVFFADSASWIGRARPRHRHPDRPLVAARPATGEGNALSWRSMTRSTHRCPNLRRHVVIAGR